MRTRSLVVLFVSLITFFSACSPAGSPTPAFPLLQPGQPTPVVVRILDLDAALQEAAPTPEPTSAPTATQVFLPTRTPAPAGPAAQASTSTPLCTNKAEFVKHLTVSDNTALEAGQPFSKIWQLKNTGTCAWSTAYGFRFFSGEAMTGQTEIPLPNEVKPGETVDIRVDLVAPLTMASFTGNWVLTDERGEVFGVGEAGNQPLSVIINVKPTPKPSPG